MTAKLPAINIAKLESLFCQMDIAGVKYGLGAKVPYLDISPSRVKKIDCSGFVRYAIYQATDGKLTICDGSQNQRCWCEKLSNQGKLRKLNQYSDVLNMTDRSLFIAFIKPNAHGCGSIGHVWFITKLNADDIPDTMESHGGVGINSRRWDYLTLKRQVYSCFELPTE